MAWEIEAMTKDPSYVGHNILSNGHIVSVYRQIYTWQLSISNPDGFAVGLKDDSW